MTASLPMYLRPETADIWQRLWGAVHQQTGLGPAVLDQPSDLWTHWRDPALVLSQTCGLPFRMGLHETATLVGTLDFVLPDTPAGQYHSVILKGPKDGPVALNGADSQSGWAALWGWSGGDLPEGRTITGAHSESLRAVAEGRAGLAAVDAVTWALVCDHDPDLIARVKVIGRTEPTPALPLITNQPQHAKTLFDAFAAAIADLSPADRATLHLRGIVSVPKAAYLAQPLPPAP